MGGVALCLGGGWKWRDDYSREREKSSNYKGDVRAPHAG